MFSKDYREDVRNQIIEKVRTDSEIVSAAVIGSYARNEVDQYSDIDLTFGINDDLSINKILDKYRRYVEQEFSGEFLFELKQDHTLYGVFILPGCLQVDLSYTPQKQFGPKAYPFNLLFGNHTGEKKASPHEPIKEKFGLIVHHLLHTKIGVERNQLEKANKWLRSASQYLEEYDLNLNKKHADKEVISKHKILEELSVLIDALPQIKQENNESHVRIIKILEGLRN